MNRSIIHDFSPGVNIFPPEVPQMIAEAILNWNQSGQSILATSESSPEFAAVISKLKLLVRELLQVPLSYRILFLNGGVCTQYHRIPESLLKKKANYLDSGFFASEAIRAARHYGQLEVVASSADKNYAYIPDVPCDMLRGDYLHTFSNNIVEGTQIFEFRNVGIPHICDMSSDLFTRVIKIRDFDLIYSETNQNIGLEGMTIMIVKEDMLTGLDPQLPLPNDNILIQKENSHFPLPPLLCLYTAMLNLIWLKAQGGLEVIGHRNAKKATLLYEEIDRNPSFYGYAAIAHRSRMIVTFGMTTSKMENDFLTYAFGRGITGIRGHQTLGGFRVCLSNALPISSVNALIQVMYDFHQSCIQP